MILLNPGPVTLSERVRSAMLRPDLCHREPEFAALQASIRRKLLAVYDLDPDAWAAVLLTGSGTAAVEAMIASLAPPTGLAVLENGIYGERISHIAAAHHIPCARIEHGWEEEPDPARVRAAVADGGWLAAVHHETTTGRLNRVDPLAAGGATVLLDAVSSFGAEEIPFGEGRVEACAATANKCLHGVPGTAFVLLRRTFFARDRAPRTVYLDLAAHCRAQDAASTLFTPSVQTCYALDEALDELAEAGGWRARRARYRALMSQVRGELAALGVEPILPEGASSCVLNAFRLPAGLSYAALHDGLKARGFVIYAGQGRLAEAVFRIAVMGAIADADMDRLVAALRAVLA